MGIRGSEIICRVALSVCVLAFLVLPVAPQESNPSLPRHFARCTATRKIVCEDGECKSVPPTVFFLLGKHADRNNYSRCDQQGCDTYEAMIKKAGLFENWQLVEPQGVIFKRALSEDQSFVEVATLGLQVYISTGHCKVANE